MLFDGYLINENLHRYFLWQFQGNLLLGKFPFFIFLSILYFRMTDTQPAPAATELVLHEQSEGAKTFAELVKFIYTLYFFYTFSSIFIKLFHRDSWTCCVKRVLNWAIKYLRLFKRRLCRMHSKVKTRVVRVDVLVLATLEQE